MGPPRSYRTLSREIRDQEIINIEGSDYASLYIVQIKSQGLSWVCPRNTHKPHCEKAALQGRGTRIHYNST